MAEDRVDGWADRTVGDVVAEDYGRAAVFRSFGIDFCCGGGRTVGAACDEAGVAYEAVARALSGASGAGEPGVPDPTSWELDLLAGYITGVHHGYVRATLPLLREFTSKVARVHGDRHPELQQIRELIGDLSVEMERHMAEEEEVLFPRIAALKSGAGPADAGRGVRAAVSPLEDDHARAGDLMLRIRRLSGGFTPPPDACTTYRAAFAKLEEFEADLHRHVHLENNVLFPRAAAAEAALMGAGSAP